MYLDEKNKIDFQSIDFIFNRMIESITSSKNDIYVICEQSRRTYEEMKIELEWIKQKLKVIISNSDSLARQTQLAKHRLVEVSKNFEKYSEQQIREAYEMAHNLQMKLSLSETEEKILREKRDDLERRLKSLYDTIQRADHIVNQVNVVLNYLTSDLKNVGAALEEAKLKHEFGIKIIAAQEEERKKLSREIHDGPAQMMANVLMRADLIEKIYRDRGIEEAMKEISELKSSVRAALSEVRRIIYDLRPMALDDLGIVPTLKKYLSTVMDYNKGIDIHFQSYNSETRLPSNYEVAIFRLVQECVNNAVKHANPTEIWVRLEWSKSHLNVIVKDNGRGFNLDEKREQSFGIIGMRERVEILDGSMEIKTKIGSGTIVMFKIPYPNK
ncbi:sensor histidine kinase [Ureibacillus thermophilus]|uniref:sensor histidine kinase n=1 Tax=Ureibacillus thermophilus TaxID=367743 RepID=UPI0036087EFC